MEYLPLFFALRQTRVLLVGGGRVALRKARLLQQAGAQLTVVAPEIDPELKDMLLEAGSEWKQDVFRDSYLEGVVLIVAATPERAVNSNIAAAAGRRNIPVNVVDSPDLCSFIFPSIVDRSPLVIAIGSSGRSPVLARLLRTRIEALIPAAYGRLAAFTGLFRDAIKQAVPAEGQRRRFWERVVEGPIGELVLAGQDERAGELMQSAIDSPAEHPASGEVYLVGAGPGDPDLLTFKAVRLLQTADVILYDRLVSPRVLDMARRDAERVYVGKRRADHTVPQQEINQLLLEMAQQGQRVVRLKGGDPFIFGRGGEELELLAEHGIPFQVIPGVTAASGCACYAGIPLTHRDYAQSVRFVTGQLQNDRIDLPWEELATPNQTVVFYMGLQGLPTICRELQASGRGDDTPIALVEQGTTENQRTITGTLATMGAIVADQEVHAPTLIIVGEVVLLQDQLAWWNETADPGSWPPASNTSR